MHLGEIPEQRGIKPFPTLWTSKKLSCCRKCSQLFHLKWKWGTTVNTSYCTLWYFQSGRTTVATSLVCCMESMSKNLIQRWTLPPFSILTLTTLHCVHLSEPLVSILFVLNDWPEAHQKARHQWPMNKPAFLIRLLNDLPRYLYSLQTWSLRTGF